MDVTPEHVRILSAERRFDLSRLDKSHRADRRPISGKLFSDTARIAETSEIKTSTRNFGSSAKAADDFFTRNPSSESATIEDRYLGI